MEQPDGLPEPRRSFAVAAILVSIVITVLDTAMINVALPAIGRDLGVDPASVIWLTNGYQVVVVSTLISFASLAEILGFRRVFLAGMMGLDVTASLGCALRRPSRRWWRRGWCRGSARSAVMALTAGLVRYTYPSRQLGRAIGVNAMTVAISAAAGAVDRLGHSGAGELAVAVRGGCAVGHRRHHRRLPHPAADAAAPRRRFDAAAAGLAALAFGLLFLGADLLLPSPWLGAAGMAAGRWRRWRWCCGTWRRRRRCCRSTCCGCPRWRWRWRVRSAPFRPGR